MSGLFERVAEVAVRWPQRTLAAVLVLSVAGAIGAFTLDTDAGTETLVDDDSAEFQATERFRESFGDEAAVVLVREDLRQLTLTQDLQALFELETCLAGGTQLAQTLPRREGAPLPEVCDQIAELAPSRVVYGPATFLYQSVAQIQQVLQGQIGATQQAAAQAAVEARKQAAAEGASESEVREAGQRAAQEVLGAFQSDLVRLGLKYGITSPPRLDDPAFINRVVFDPREPVGTPKERFAYLFPGPEAALISVRLRPDLTDEERGRAIDLFRQATSDPRFALGGGGDYVVSGVPAVVDGLAEALRSELLVLLLVAVALMAIALLVVLSPPLRLLPLGVALAAAALTFGLLALLGGSLTMASVAVLPVLIGLAVDYAIQFQARFGEAKAEGMAPARAAVAAAGRGGPLIGTACAATAVGFAALAFSPIPMVRSFGLLLVAGIALAFAVAATAGFAALALASWRGEPVAPRDWGPKSAALGRRAKGWSAWLRARGKSALGLAIGRPAQVLAVASALALIGWVAGSRTEVVSDIRDLAPSGLPALEDVNALQDETGVSGEINVVVRSDELANPEVINWISGFQRRVLADAGYEGERPSCDEARLCPAISLTDLFAGGTPPQTEQQVRGLIESIPAYFSQAVITREPNGAIGDTANIAFGIRVQPLDEQQELIEEIRSQVDAEGGPPEGTEVELAGLPVIAAAANSDLSRSRYWLPLLGLAAVALALLAIYRSPRRALVPLVPVVLATGWSALVVAVLGVSLNPMSATLGALVIAIATEFSVILSGRFERERATGLSVGEALRRTYSLTGAAVLASGITAIAGFAALVATDIRMLRDFGLVTVADLAVALVGVLLVLPATLVLADQRFGAGARRRAQEPAGARAGPPL
jgi:uncharacterized protein